MATEEGRPIENRDRVNESQDAEIALDCLDAGITAANPAIGVRECLAIDGTSLTVGEEEFDLSVYDRILVLGGGNAAGHAAAALEEILGEFVDDGTIVTDNPVETDRIRMLPGDHPIPTERGVESTRELLSLADSATTADLVITLLTGGGSALMVAPDGIGLDDLRATTDGLLASGATIEEINAVRKHLSAVKGGHLARRLFPATSIGLLCSDVVGDKPSVIASGPLTPDESTYSDAMSVLEENDVVVPDSVEDLLRDGKDGGRDETPSTGDEAFVRVSTYIVTSNATATATAAETARERGFNPLVLGSRFRGRAKEVGKVLVGIAEAVKATGNPVEPPAVLVAGGETTVEISDDGNGGPNQELVVSAGRELNEERITVAAVDTDGIDGKSEAAGGIVTSETVDDRRAAGAAIATNDTAPYLEEIGGSIRTGPTGTNVNDLYIAVVSAPE